MIAVLAALSDEIAQVLPRLTEPQSITIASRRCTTGLLAGCPIVLALTRIGKVAAATTAASLLSHFRPQAVLFAGLAGALTPDLRIGDVVIARRFIQHDLDASPLFPPLEVPLTGRSWFDADRVWTQRLAAAATHVVGDLPPPVASAVRALGLSPPRVHLGDVATGDRFIAGDADRARVRALVPDAVCVEMEGAAVAQVCSDFGVPFAACRVISDTANAGAAADFEAFIRTVESGLTAAVIERAVASSA